MTHPPVVHVGSEYVVGDYRDRDLVWLWFLGIFRHLGVTVTGAQRFDFPGGGVSGVVLIAESHAAIHTWPEHGTAWVELATCSSEADVTKFLDLVRSGPQLP